MGNSLSQDSQSVLEAATAGDVSSLKSHIEGAPRLLDSVTLLKRRSVLHIAAKRGHSDVISAVLDPLLDAVREEYYAQQEQEQEQPPQAALPPEQLLSFKRLRHTVNARDLYRRTPLIIAAKQGHLHCTQLLVEAASNLFAVDREGNTSLHYAALHGHLEVVEYLLQRASERGLAPRFVNKANLSGFNALHYAVWGCREAVLGPLLAAGADVAATNQRVFDAWVPVPIGSTPLHLAVMRGREDIAKQLLRHFVLTLATAPADAPRPSDPRTVLNLYGMNPAQLAAHRNQRRLAQLLLPSLPLSRVLAAAADVPRALGPPSLKSIAAGVLQAELTRQLDALDAATQAQAQQQHCTPAAGPCCNACVCASAPACGARHCCSCCCPASLPASRAASPASSSNGSDGSGSSGSSGVGISRSDSSGSSSSSSSVEPDLVVVQQQLVAACTAAPCPACSTPAADCAATCDACCVPAAERSGGSFSSSGAAAGACSGATSAIARASSSGWYDELCCVCWEAEVTAVLRACGHALCLGCARQLVDASAATGATCPLCRAAISGFEAVPHTARGGRKKGYLLAGSGI